MPIPIPGGYANTNPNGVISVSPGVWVDASHPVQMGNRESDDIQAAVILALNDLMEALGGLSFVQGATNFASALEIFANNIGLSLGCVAVDMAVISSGLQAAAHAFSSLDNSLTLTFAHLESQLTYLTTNTSLTPIAAPTYTPYHSPAPSSGGNPFSEIWHGITHISSSVYHGTVHGLESIGAPGWLAVGIAGLATGIVDTGAVAGGAAVAAAG